jgi:bromodomain-containing protein 4
MRMDIDRQQEVQTKGALKGWSTLMPEKTGPTTPQSAGPKKVVSTSDTFDAFRKAAKEKADRERGLKEQQELARQQKERSERERRRQEQERRKEKEEEDGLEQARIALSGPARPAPAPVLLPAPVSSPPRQPVVAPPPIPQPSPTPAPLTVTPPTTSPVAVVPSPADQARMERERQRQREQDRRRREAQQNQIDMNRQSDMMAAFEENIIWSEKESWRWKPSYKEKLIR